MLTPTHLATLRALMNRIIPPDDYPGAWEAGVGDYLIRQFERDLKDHVNMYRLGLEALNAEAQAHAGVDFATLDPEAQDELLRHIEKGEVKTPWPTPPIPFFKVAVEHVVEGFYSDLGNGGNREGIAWKMIGFEVRG